MRLILLLCFATNCFFIAPHSYAEPKNPDVIIDLAGESQKIVTLNKTGAIRVKVINMVPAQRDSYLLQTDQVVYEVKPLETPTSPSNLNAAQDHPQCSDAWKLEADTLLGTLAAVDTPKRVAEKTKEINVLVGKEKEAVCSQKVKFQAFLASREGLVDAYIDQNLDVRVTVSLGTIDDVQRSVLIKPIRKEWISSYGFGFVYNRDTHYQTVGNTTDGFVVERQDDRQSMSYSALMVFTYPLGDFGNGVEWGITGGVGATQENVSALAGISLVVSKNFIITGGISIQEFDVLKGQYSEGDNVGSQPIDSSVLAGSTYRPAAAIVLSYRFGEAK